MALHGTAATTNRVARRIKPRRPWMLIAACLLLVGLTVTLWGKWVENRERADRLAAELKKVYVEAEKLRTEATLAKQRITQLERQLRAPGPSSRTALGGPVPHLEQPAVLLRRPHRDAQVPGEAHARAVAHQDARPEERGPQRLRAITRPGQDEVRLRGG